MTFKGDHDSVPSSSDQPLTAAAPPSGGTSSRRRPGPNTAAGKEKVALNAIKSGLTSVRPILPGESRADWDAFRRAIIDDLAPNSPVATELAEGVAFAFWRRRRVIAHQLAVLDERQHLEPASARLLPGPLDIDKIIRYESHVNRQIYQGLHELEAMQDARDGKPTSLLRIDVNNKTGKLGPEESA